MNAQGARSTPYPQNEKTQALRVASTFLILFGWPFRDNRKVSRQLARYRQKVALRRPVREHGSQAAGRLRSVSAILKPAALIIASSVLSLGLPRSDSAR